MPDAITPLLCELLSKADEQKVSRVIIQLDYNQSHVWIDSPGFLTPTIHIYMDASVLPGEDGSVFGQARDKCIFTAQEVECELKRLRIVHTTSLFSQGFKLLSSQWSIEVVPTDDTSYKIGIGTPVENHQFYDRSLAACNTNNFEVNGNIFSPSKGLLLVIRQKAEDLDDISRLLKHFYCDIFQVTSPFFQYITEVEALIRFTDGAHTTLGKSVLIRRQIENNPRDPSSLHFDTTFQRGPDSCRWLVVHYKEVSLEEAIGVLVENLGVLPLNFPQQRYKSDVTLAFPFDLIQTHFQGRLLDQNMIPCTSPTGLPIHICAALALDALSWQQTDHIEIGSLDESLSEWNKVVANEIVPKAWGCLLEFISSVTTPSNIYCAWPQSAIGLWSTLPIRILRFAAEQNLSIFPIHPSCAEAYDGATTYTSLDDLLVVEEDTACLPLLATAGVLFSLPPPKLSTVMLKSKLCKRLIPEDVSQCLRNHFDMVSSLSSDAKLELLSYLLSTSNVLLATDLPIIPLSTGEFRCIAPRTENKTNYTLLQEDECDLFISYYDEHTILLSSLPLNTQAVFLSSVHLVNVTFLPLNLHPYLQKVAISAELAWVPSSPSHPQSWLVLFWAWIATRKIQLSPESMELELFPDISGRLRKTPEFVFEKVNVNLDADLSTILDKLGIIFLNPGFPTVAIAWLRNEGRIRSPTDGVALLHALSIDAAIESSEASRFRTYLQTRLTNVAASSLSHVQVKLKGLPIYPIFSTIDGSHWFRVTWGSTGRTSEQKVVFLDVSYVPFSSDGSKWLLPIVGDTTFVASTFEGISMHWIIPYLNTKLLTDGNVLSFYIQSFEHQSRDWQITFIEYLLRNQPSPFPFVVLHLKVKPCLTVGLNYGLRSAEEVIDPCSRIARLFDTDDEFLPDPSDSSNQAFLQYFRSQNLLCTNLTPPIVARILELLDSNRSTRSAEESKERATLFLVLLESASIDCFEVVANSTLHWMPTTQGLVASHACRDDLDKFPSELFDHVLIPLDCAGAPIISQGLRRALGWGQALSVDTIIHQLDEELRTLSTPSKPQRLEVLLKELGSRYDELELRGKLPILQSMTSGRPWIPISATDLSTTQDVTLDQRATKISGLHSVPRHLCSNPNVLKFLISMGCPERVENCTLLKRLTSYSSAQLSRETLDDVIQILEMLDLSDEEDIHSHLIAPDDCYWLRPIRNLYHKGVGPQDIQISDGSYQVVHPNLSSSLVTRLRIPSAASVWIREQDLHPHDVRGINTALLQGVLEVLPADQALHEIAGTLAQIGITTLDVILDERLDITSNHFATPWNNSSSACIIHTDKVLAEDQIEQMCASLTTCSSVEEALHNNITVGYGSLFRFSEAAIIVSGDSVLFLDPSNNHFTCRIHSQKNIFRVSLGLHKGIDYWLHRLHGLHGFNDDTTYYSGTLFLLPLGETSVLGGKYAGSIPVGHTKDLIQTMVSVIPQVFLFTGITNASAMHRSSSSEAYLWKASCTHSEIDHEETMHSELVEVEVADILGTIQTQSWCVATEQISNQYLQSEDPMFAQLLPCRKDCHLSLAVSISNSDGEGSSNGFYFSQGPILQATNLPVYIAAPFELAQDRQSILLASPDANILDPQQSFNAWLVEAKAPPLYLYLLESLPADYPTSYLWPTYHTVTPSVSNSDGRQIFTRSYYNSFPETLRKICDTIDTQERICPKDAVFHNTNNSAHVIDVVIDKFHPSELVTIPDHLWHCIGQNPICPADAHFIRRVLLRAPIEMLQTLTIQDCNDIIEFLLECSVDLLDGLQIAPLQNGTLGVLHRDGHDDKLFSLPDQDSPLLSLFPTARILDSKLSISSALFGQTNVVLLIPNYISDLLEDVIPSQDVYRLSLQQQAWMSTFLPYFLSLSEVATSAVSAFPLLPTRIHGVHVSIRYTLQSPLQVFKPPTHSSYNWLCPIIEELGGHFLDTKFSDQLETSRRSDLQFNGLSLNLSRLIEFVTSVACSTRLPHISNSNRTSLATLIVDEIASSIIIEAARMAEESRMSHKKKGGRSKFSRSVYSSIPISVVLGDGLGLSRYQIDNYTTTLRSVLLWDSQTWCGDHVIVALDDPRLWMLPNTLKLSHLKAFLMPSTGHTFLDYNLQIQKVFNIQPVAESKLISCIQLPDIADIDDPEWVADFEQLLALVMRVETVPATSSVDLLLVPNACGVMVKPSTLYSRSNILFARTLQHRPRSFLHPKLQNSEAGLARFGLRDVVDKSSFKLCVRVVDQDVRSGREQGAIALFNWYNDHVGRDDAMNGFSLDDIEDALFIPRSESRRNFKPRTTFCPTNYAVQLGSIVSPNQILLPQYETVAWTQRALCSITPSVNLMTAHPDFGIPTDAQVIEHLRTLVIIADDHPCDPNVLSDLTDTYTHLTSHSSCHELLLDLQREQLFLNVDDPSNAESWRFASVNQLVLDGHDEDQYQVVSHYLLQFRDLLQCIGVKTLIRTRECQHDECQFNACDERPLDSLKVAYQEQRKDRVFTDVTFISSEGLSSFANRAFLVATTDHFKHHFTAGFSEGKSCEVSCKIALDDVPHLAIESVLDYIYTDRIANLPCDQETLKEVLKLLHIWGLEETTMFTSIQHQIIPTISLASHIELLSLADLLQAQCLRSACNTFTDNNFELIQSLTL